MIREIAVYHIAGQPVAILFGILAVYSFLITALLGLLNYRKLSPVTFKWHPIWVGIALTMVTIHVILIELISS